MEDPDQEGMIHHSGKLRNQDQDISLVRESRLEVDSIYLKYAHLADLLIDRTITSRRPRTPCLHSLKYPQYIT